MMTTDLTLTYNLNKQRTGDLPALGAGGGGDGGGGEGGVRRASGPAFRGTAGTGGGGKDGTGGAIEPATGTGTDTATTSHNPCELN